MPDRINLADLDSAQIRAYARAQGWWDRPGGQVEELTGGVSGVVLVLGDTESRVVLKQARSQLIVERDWWASTARAEREAVAIDLWHRLLPAHGPRLYGYDPAAEAFAIEAAPVHWTNWKEQLLAGTAPHVAPDICRDIGQCLRLWHEHTATIPAADAVDVDFANTGVFMDLRLRPFYWEMADAIGGEAGRRIEALAVTLLEDQQCLVHGDVSPKNILRPPTSETGAWWLIDAECTTMSSPVFDVAFLITHILLKSAVPAAGDLWAATNAVWEGYQEPGGHINLTESDLVHHVAVLLLARVQGISQVAYLTAARKESIAGFAEQVLFTRAPALGDLRGLVSVTA